jgi:hypothetical protein
MTCPADHNPAHPAQTLPNVFRARSENPTACPAQTLPMRQGGQAGTVAAGQNTRAPNPAHTPGHGSAPTGAPPKPKLRLCTDLHHYEGLTRYARYESERRDAREIGAAFVGGW